MAKYSQEFKLKVVHHYLNDGGFKSTGKVFKIHKSVVNKWGDIYKIHGADGLNRVIKNQVYSVEFKLQVVESVLNDGLSYAEILVKFKLKELGTISMWLHQYQKSGIEGLKPKPRGRSKQMPKPKTTRVQCTLEDRDKTQEQLLEELAYLRAENAYLKKRRAFIQKQQEQEQAEQQRLQDSFLN
ncbi:transposase [Acinetobacter sp. Ac_1271]|nr:helix-turn-helix domain-containing protein [Acinetobacter guerrae]MPW45846.1 transposase [Acinetobacter guerrae]